MLALGRRRHGCSLFARSPAITACCAARLLTGRGLGLVCTLGVGDPCFKGCQPSRLLV